MSEVKYKAAIFLAPALLLAAFLLAPDKSQPVPARQVANSGIFTSPVAKERPENNDLQEAIKGNPDLSLYWRALQKSGQSRRLRSVNKLTLFAPSNQALTRNRGLYERLLVNKGQLRKTMRYTIVAGREKIKKSATLTTLSGDPLTISADGKYVGEGRVVAQDKIKGNILYIVDELNLPYGVEIN